MHYANHYMEKVEFRKYFFNAKDTTVGEFSVNIKIIFSRCEVHDIQERMNKMEIFMFDFSTLEHME